MTPQIRSFWPKAAHPLALLSNRRIAHYERTGHYGLAAQARRLHIDLLKAECASLPPLRGRSSVKCTLNLSSLI